MRFEKPALTMEEQAVLLEARGMGGSRDRILGRLEQVNYYRLAAYWHPFREDEGDFFRPGTTIDEVWDRYLFDRRLRLLTLDAVERFEVTVRTRLAYELASVHGPFGVYGGSSLFRDDPAQRVRFLSGIYGDFGRNGDVFMKHFYSKYGDEHDAPPIWVAVEILSFGKVVRLFKGSSPSVRRSVAHHLGIAHSVLESWLLTLNTVRNVCAHHGRLWNRTLGYRPRIPRAKSHPEWKAYTGMDPAKVFASLTILAYVLGQIAPGSGWARRLEALLELHPAVPAAQMGFADDWKSTPIWARMLQGARDK